jgi:hypothetical protein
VVQPVQPLLPLPLVDRLVFEGGTQDFSGDIFAVKTDGSDRRRLTETDNADFCPALSPDGNWIAFLREPRSPEQGRNPLMILMKADGTDQRVLGSYKTAYAEDCPVWSRDSHLVAFSSPAEPLVRDANSPLIRTYDTGGNIVAEFTAGQFGFYSFSPDNSRFLYSTHGFSIGPPIDFRLETVKLDGTERLEIASGFHGDWNLDGTGIVYDACSDFCGVSPIAPCPGVCTIRIDGTNAQTLAATGRDPVFSPAGDRVAYVCGNDLCVVPAGGGQPTVIAGAGAGSVPVWSSDGEHVAYFSSVGSQTDIFVADVQTGMIANVTNTPSNERTPSFSPVSAH